MVWIFVFFVVCILVFSLSMSSLASEQKNKEEKIEKQELEKTNLAFEAYVSFLKRSPTSEEIKEMSETEIRHFLSTKIDRYKSTLGEIKKIDIPWYGGLQHVKGVDKRRADKRTELVKTIESDGLEIIRIEEIIGTHCAPKPLKRFRIQN